MKCVLWIIFVILALQIKEVLGNELWTVQPNTGHKGLPSCDPKVAQSSGYIEIPGVDGGNKHFFYWLFAPRQVPTSGTPPPLVVWFSGGPGCSSEIALALENGPCLIKDDSFDVKYNPFGWNDEAYLLYVDQPIGTGYSYSENEKNVESNEKEVARDIYEFLQQFSNIFTTPSISGNNSLYITGESYAGHYIPAIARRIMEENRKGDRPILQLKGVAIGNGYTNPEIQYQSQPYYAYFYCQQAFGTACVTKEVYEKMVKQLPDCLLSIRNCTSNSSPNKHSVCLKSKQTCSEMAFPPSMQERNRYDVRKMCEGALCYPTEYLATFFNNHSIKSALGVHPGVAWAECSKEVNLLFAEDSLESFDSDVAQLLDWGLNVMLYEGDTDYICNFIGNLLWVKSLKWNGREAFHAAPEVEFRVGERWGGSVRTSGPLSFVRIYNAGHMVPRDQPEVALYMLNHFINKIPLVN